MNRFIRTESRPSMSLYAGVLASGRKTQRAIRRDKVVALVLLPIAGWALWFFGSWFVSIFEGAIR